MNEIGDDADGDTSGLGDRSNDSSTVSMGTPPRGSRRCSKIAELPPAQQKGGIAVAGAATSDMGALAGEESSPEASPKASVPPPPDLGATSAPHLGGNRSVRELKALLSSNGVDFSSCVEKSDLEALWARFELLRTRPLDELRASCAAAGGPRHSTADECARFLIAPT